ncbi:MAG: hypothetical protein SOR61_07640, partial [Evtepia sp.]|uniref:hypothetical protein n=1 Tax=Evtepia sp. TaxID=2773933 RepID=UPI002A74CD2C
MEDVVVMLVCAVLGSTGLSTIVTAVLNRHWHKKDNEDKKLDAIVTGLKVLMTYRVRRNVERCVDRGNVSLDEKEDVKEMFQAYKALGGNG